MPKNIAKKELIWQNTVKKILVIGIIIAVSSYFVFLFIYGDKGIIRYMELKDKRVELEAQIRSMKIENEMLEQRNNSLMKDPQAVEDLAREMGYKKENEIIFKFKE
jgi:cell division protein FtsB